MIPTDLKNTGSRIRQAWLLNALFIVVFGVSAAIPVHLELLPAAVERDLPIIVGDWIGKEDKDHSKEREILAPDTKISKSNYRDRSGNLIQASLVISGQDLNNSIHRPERCLRAQGHGNIARDSFELELDDGTTLPVSHLTSTKKFQFEDDVEELTFQSFYWFVGHKELTNSHYKRSFIDIRDRLTGGTAQQWAYISLSTRLSPEESESDRQIVEAFIKALASRITTLD